MRHRLGMSLGLAFALLLSGCKGNPLAKTPKPVVSTGPVATAPGVVPVVSGASPAPVDVAGFGGLGPANGGGIISDQNSSLTGVVRAPAGLIGNNSGNLVTDNGSGLIGNNAGNFRLLASPAQVAYAGVDVQLLDAAGQALSGPDGKALLARTDAQGRYRFAAALPARNLLVAVTLPGNNGRLVGIAPPGLPSERQADLDLVSTLTTAYILDRYVKDQADPLATLDKLPRAVEVETRTRAAAALAASAMPEPTRLTSADAVRMVDALRQADTAFNAQLETVRQLLVAVGQSDMGSGRPALEVGLRAIGSVVPAPGGGYYFSTPKVHRVWRLMPDGRLVTAAGIGVPKPGSLAGTDAALAGLEKPYGLSLDAAGRLLMADQPTGDGYRLHRLGADGHLSELWRGQDRILAAYPGSGDEVRMLTLGAAGEVVLWALTAGATPRALHTFEAEAAGRLALTAGFGLDSQGRLVVGLSGENAEALRLDPMTFALTPLGREGDGDLERLAVMPDGRLATVRRAGDVRSLGIESAAGPRTVVLPALAPTFFLGSLQGASVAPGGGLALVQRGNLLYTAADGALTLIAGKLDPTSGGATDIAIDYPAGMALGPSGQIYMSDKLANKVLRINSDQSVNVISGTGTAGTAGDGGPADMAQQDQPRALRRDGAGNLYVLQGGFGVKVRLIDVGGNIRTAFKVDNAEYIRDFSVAADGTGYMALRHRTDLTCTVVRVAKDGTQTLIHDHAAFDGAAIAVDPQGALVMLIKEGTSRRLVRWTEAGGEQLIIDDPRLAVTYPNDSNCLAVDAQGRVVITLIDENQVWVYDPVTKALGLAAGEGARHFSGDAVDDSLNRPRFPVFAPNGDLYFSDTHHHQVKRIPAGEF